MAKIYQFKKKYLLVYCISFILIFRPPTSQHQHQKPATRMESITVDLLYNMVEQVKDDLRILVDAVFQQKNYEDQINQLIQIVQNLSDVMKTGQETAGQSPQVIIDMTNMRAVN